MVGVGGSHKERFKGYVTSCEGVKREAVNRLGWRRSVRSSVGHRQGGATVSCYSSSPEMS